MATTLVYARNITMTCNHPAFVPHAESTYATAASSLVHPEIARWMTARPFTRRKPKRKEAEGK